MSFRLATVPLSLLIISRIVEQASVEPAGSILNPEPPRRGNISRDGVNPACFNPSSRVLYLNPNDIFLNQRISIQKTIYVIKRISKTSMITMKSVLSFDWSKRITETIF